MRLDVQHLCQISLFRSVSKFTVICLLNGDYIPRTHVYVFSNVCIFLGVFIVYCVSIAFLFCYSAYLATDNLITDTQTYNTDYTKAVEQLCVLYSTDQCSVFCNS